MLLLSLSTSLDTYVNNILTLEQLKWFCFHLLIDKFHSFSAFFLVPCNISNPWSHHNITKNNNLAIFGMFVSMWCDIPLWLHTVKSHKHFYCPAFRDTLKAKKIPDLDQSLYIVITFDNILKLRLLGVMLWWQCTHRVSWYFFCLINTKRRSDEHFSWRKNQCESTLRFQI